MIYLKQGWFIWSTCLEEIDCKFLFVFRLERTSQHKDKEGYGEALQLDNPLWARQAVICLFNNTPNKVHQCMYVQMTYFFYFLKLKKEESNECSERCMGE